MSDPVELSDSLYDDSLETVGTVSPGASPYKIRVAAALQTQIAGHETRIDALEASSGTGDVVGPASATDNAVARFDSTTGKLIQNSVVTIADSTGNMAGVGTLNTRTIANWVDGPASAASGAVPTFSGTGGKLVADSGVLLSNLVVGPASATDNAIVRFDGTTGKLVQNSAVTVADTTGSIDNTGGSGTVTSTRFVGPATALRSATTDMTVSAAAAPSAGQVLTATSSTVLAWATPSAGTPSLASIGLNEYWCADANISYGAKTDEFTAGSLGGSWSVVEWSTWSAPTNGGAVDSTSLPAASNYKMTPNARNSWLMLQPAPSGTGVDLALRRSFTYVGATGFQFRTRFTGAVIGDVSSGAATSNGLSRFHITKDSSGNPDLNNYIAAGFTNSNPQVIGCLNQVGGSNTPISYATDNSTDGEFIFIGTGNAGTITIKVYFRGPVGCRLIYSGQQGASNGATLWLVWRITCTSNPDPNIYAMDYFREYPDLKITP